MKIEKKVWTYYFQKILDGKKNFELRLANFQCREGDILVLKEWDPEEGVYTGRQIEKEITYVTTLKDIPFWSPSQIEEHGFQIISFRSD
ncbi:MAG TPA: DUF3850 domain-containing protein [Candidatus Nanoarchaeia archaeon]|nr:DUF3850 domain-containing protein [Candidatus Nanoarchaeia archaeon]